MSRNVYPESDGKPVADNPRQLRWIFLLYGNFCALFRSDPDVFVGGNQFWYPVEGHPEIVTTPDVYLAFGRPKGDRGSYKQWEEGDVPLTVVFEILSPEITTLEMAAKFTFYEQYGVEEYYEYDPDTNRLSIYLRQGERLRPVRSIAGFVSPRLGIRFDLSGAEMVVFGPDGRRFLSFEDLAAEVMVAERRVEETRQRRLAAEQLCARLIELSRKARCQQATPEELAELERLEEQASPSP